jgi:hypothetical protein
MLLPIASKLHLIGEQMTKPQRRAHGGGARGGGARCQRGGGWHGIEANTVEEQTPMNVSWENDRVRV